MERATIDSENGYIGLNRGKGFRYDNGITRYMLLCIEEVRVTRTTPTICLPLGSNRLVLELFQQASVKINVVAILLRLIWSRGHSPDVD